MDISSQWTDAERLQVVRQIAFRLSGMRYPDRQLAYIVQALCTESAAYLENNRAKLLAATALDADEKKRAEEEEAKQREVVELERKVSKWNWRRSGKPIFGKKG